MSLDASSREDGVDSGLRQGAANKRQWFATHMPNLAVRPKVLILERNFIYLKPLKLSENKLARYLLSCLEL
jgi:hypothetical protein